jgi:Tfp pilus assembly protein PilF
MAPSAPQGYHGLGRVALKRGDAREARRQFQQALRVDPGFEDARRELARLGPP